MNKKMKTLLVTSVIVGLIIFFHYLNWLQPVENSLRSLITPASKLLYTFSVNLAQEEDFFSSPEELKQTYKNLKEELLKNKIKTADFKLLQDENTELRQQLNFLQKKSFQSIGAEVEYHEYPMQHSVSEESIEAIANWIKTQLAK